MFVPIIMKKENILFEIFPSYPHLLSVEILVEGWIINSLFRTLLPFLPYHDATVVTRYTEFIPYFLVKDRIYDVFLKKATTAGIKPGAPTLITN